MVEALVEVLEIDFSWVLIEEIHKRELNTFTTYLFSCLIFHICSDAREPICHYDKYCRLSRTMDMSLITDENSVAAPHRGPRIEVPPLSENLADTVKRSQGVDTFVLGHVDPLRPPPHMQLTGPPSCLDPPQQHHWSIQLESKSQRHRWLLSSTTFIF